MAVAFILALTMGFSQLQLSQDSLDFGVMGWHDTTGVIELVNTGKDTVTIVEVSTSCGCTTASIDSQIIPPGRHAKLTVTFSPASHQIQGEVYREVYIRTNRASDSLLTLRIYAKVIPPSWAVNQTLPQEILQAPGLRTAYGYVLEHRDEIAQFPCYCGCGTKEQHQNLADCYVQNEKFQAHASTCAICVSEVLDIIKLRRQGQSLEEIQQYIKNTYQSMEGQHP